MVLVGSCMYIVAAQSARAPPALPGTAAAGGSAGASSAGAGDSKDPHSIDEATGLLLPAAAVKKARREEIKYFHERGVYAKVSLEECWATLSGS